MAKKLTTPITEEQILDLKAGDEVSITGTIYTARDSAHKLLVEALERGETLPFDLKGQIIYYAGPAPAKPGQPIGSVGPTTSYRMDSYTPTLLAQGLKACIGKGNRSEIVVDALKQYKGVYLAAIGGVAALLAKRVKTAKIVAYPELGPEAVNQLYVEDFPAVVVNDCYGADLYKEGIAKYQKTS